MVVGTEGNLQMPILWRRCAVLLDYFKENIFHAPQLFTFQNEIFKHECISKHNCT